MKKRKIDSELIRTMAYEWKWILKYVYRYKGSIALYVILGVVATGMSLGTSVASKYLIDAVLSKSSEIILQSACLVIGLAVFQILFQSGASWITAVISTKTNNEMRNEIYSHVITSDWEEINGFHSGELLNRIEGDVSSVSSGIISFIPSVFTRSLQFIGSLAIVLYYDKTMAFLALLSAPFLVLSSRFLIRTMRKYNQKSRELNGKVLSFSEESLRNIQVIKAFDLTKQYINNFKTIIENYRFMKLKYEKFSVTMTLVMSFIGLVVSYLCYGWGVYRLWQGAISVGTMTLFLQISGSLTSSFSSLASLAPSAISIATSAGRIMEITKYSKEQDADREKAVAMLKKSKEKGVEVIAENVSFTYRDGNEEVLKNVSFFVAPGETIGFVGPSGEGKTTILKLLLGLLSVSSGKLFIRSAGGEELDISDSTRRFCSYVPQGMSVFSGTIAENLRLICADATDEKLLEVLKSADLYDFVMSLPDGINSVIGEGGTNLSQGQAQRIAIARALLRDSKILIMDEATSALDIETEIRVLENIMISDPTRAVVITTHRESMLKYCDRVYKIDSDGILVQLD